MIVNARAIKTTPPSLPDGYVRLEYIESTGTQYIDTGFSPNQNTRVVTELKVLTGTSWRCLFGARDTNAVAEYGVDVKSATVLRSGFNSDFKEFTYDSVVKQFCIDKDKESCTINDETKVHEQSDFQTNFTMWLLGKNSGGTLWGAIKAMLYSLQIYDNGSLIRDYVPCANPQGEIGLYDLVNQQFYVNAGTGVFTAGPEV